MSSSLRIVFMGTPQFAVAPFKALLETNHKIVAVYTQPPKPAGRGYEVVRSPVHELAIVHHIPVHTPSTLKTEEELAKFTSLQADIAIVVAYGMLLPKTFLETPPLGCLNIHASLLPRWRGAAPIQRCIMAGDTTSGITLMKMDEGMDTGPILAMESIPLSLKVTSGELFQTLSPLGAQSLINHLTSYAAGHLIPTPQPTTGVTLAKKITKEEALLDFHQPAITLERKVRALNPFPGAYFYHKGVRIKVAMADVVEKSVTTESPGTIISSHLEIACAEGVLQPKVLQRPGGKMLDIDAFLNGFNFQVGDMVNDGATI